MYLCFVYICSTDLRFDIIKTFINVNGYTNYFDGFQWMATENVGHENNRRIEILLRIFLDNAETPD